MKQWNDFIGVLKTLLGNGTVDKWFKELKLDKYDARNIYLTANDSFQINWFKEHVLPIANKRCLNHQNQPYKITIRLKSEKIVKPKKTSKVVNSEHYRCLPISETLTLENFITTQSNLLTVKLLKHFSANLSKQTQDISFDANPIFIYGRPGSGKTHLLHALAASLKKNSFRPLLVSSHLFTEHFVRALKSNDMLHFREFYRSYDALLVDNIEVFSQKIATQEEFFHTFNSYHTLEKPIILSSSFAPKDLDSIEPRLTSRFEWGLVLSLNPLSNNEFKTFIQQKAKLLKLELDELSTNYLLSHVSHVSDLAKILEMLSFKQNLSYQASQIVSLNEIKPLITKVVERSKQIFSNERLMSVVSNYFKQPKEKLISSSKTKELVYPRRLCMYLMRCYGKKPYAQIGKFFAKDHSTVMTCVSYITKQLAENNPKIEADVKTIINQIKKSPANTLAEPYN